MTAPDIAKAWDEVRAHARRLRATTLRRLFETDPDRFSRLSARLDDLTIDFSREKLDAPALEALIALARAAGVAARRDAMAAGAPVNVTEGRAALHMALRGSVPAPRGDDPAATLARFLDFAEAVRQGRVVGAGGPFTHVVNIGIGGSDLGPAMAARALAPDIDGPRLRFVSNVDGADFAEAVADLDPARTLVIVSSKTFGTLETLANARLARDWLGPSAAGQMAAASANVEACARFGIPAERVFGFWDWVGGRYSVWSAIGLPLAIGIGAQRFRAFLDGAAAMDRHFLTAPAERNLPLLLGLIGVWRRNAMGWPTVALIPYDHRLARFPAYVQQLDMESNGKRVTLQGDPCPMATSPVIWGEPGTNAQHSFFQLLHQGTDVVPVDFIAAALPRAADPGHHDMLLANCLAQARALAFGRTEAEAAAHMAAAGETPERIARLAPHRTFPGDRPSTTILHRQLDPFALGRLIALFEHRAFVQGVIWNVNSFDQWGVELGKETAGGLIEAIRTGQAPGADQATRELLNIVKELRR
ncbi:glucose-6-phosphate isomerase [Oceanicella actignis]|uniref:glucose-6-phosphate isomerase n=1 Tax=Oceanicella actignis TaxID=1189325 RepID=UPI00125544F3|nr:glucose-6-phosphate isomerase [Oceanicella actignis]TYO89252.1 glucose-6-phosphate isomerase [Oceanicella actignis]